MTPLLMTSVIDDAPSAQASRTTSRRSSPPWPSCYVSILHWCRWSSSNIQIAICRRAPRTRSAELCSRTNLASSPSCTVTCACGLVRSSRLADDLPDGLPNCIPNCIPDDLPDCLPDDLRNCLPDCGVWVPPSLHAVCLPHCMRFASLIAYGLPPSSGSCSPRRRRRSPLMTSDGL